MGDEQHAAWGKPAVLDRNAPHGNAVTHNLESVLQQNINNSRYYLGLQSHEFGDLVDEIYNEARCARAPAHAASGGELTRLPRRERR